MKYLFKYFFLCLFVKSSFLLSMPGKFPFVPFLKHPSLSKLKEGEALLKDQGSLDMLEGREMKKRRTEKEKFQVPFSLTPHSSFPKVLLNQENLFTKEELFNQLKKYVPFLEKGEVNPFIEEVVIEVPYNPFKGGEAIVDNEVIDWLTTYFPSLKKLVLRSIHDQSVFVHENYSISLNQKSLKLIGKRLPHLSYLDIEGDFNDESLLALLAIRNLTHLKIHKTKPGVSSLTYEGLIPLRQLSLTHLELRGVIISNKELNVLAYFPFLTHLSLRHPFNQVTDKGIGVVFRNLTTLECFILTGQNNLTSEAFKDIKALSALRVLEVEGYNRAFLEESLDEDLEEGKKIHAFTDQAFSYLIKAPRLEVIKLKGNNLFTDKSLEMIPLFVNLRELFLSGMDNHMTTYGASHLFLLKYIQRIKLEGGDNDFQEFLSILHEQKNFADHSLLWLLRPASRGLLVASHIDATKQGYVPLIDDFTK
jgi:hypothetical protein